MVGSEVRLNLGARNRAIPGFISIDCDQHPGVDIVADVSDLSRFDDGSVSEIVASHILEHFPHPKTVTVLKEWNRVLVNGGLLYLAVPDFKRAAEIYLKTGVLGDWVQDLVNGGQEYQTAYHYAIFDIGRLREIVLSSGFSEVSRVEFLPVCHPLDCSNHVSNLDGKSVSLNVVAIK